jgi:cytochrome bd ubiquinol oxidase subunit I
LRIGGVPDPDARETRWAIEIPKALSFLATEDLEGEVLGLEAFPEDEWPNTRVVHLAFQLMVGTGFAMMALAALYWWVWWRSRRRRQDWASRRWLLVLLAASGPLGFLALEAGWIVTEMGRQPWIIYGVMRTSEAVTPAGEVGVALVGFALLYIVLGATVVYLLRRMASADEEAEHSFAGPDGAHV